MIHARKDYDRIQDPDNKIPIDEPVFLIRGQDPVGADAVRAWVRLHGEDLMRRGAISHDDLNPLVKAINLHATKMQRWAEAVGHGPATVSPDQLRLF